MLIGHTGPDKTNRRKPYLLAFVINILLFGLAFLVAYHFGTSPAISFLGGALFLFLASAVQQRKTLRESEERFRSMVDAVPVMVWMSGTDARCTFFNKSWLDFTGLTLKEQSDEVWVGRVHPEDRKRCVNEYLIAFKSRKTVNLEYRLLRNDGLYRWINHRGVPRYAADGSFLGFIGSCVDFTDYREAEEHVREVSTQLITAQEIDRYRIGHVLHEDLAQKLCALSFSLSLFSCKHDGTCNMAAGVDELQQQLRSVSEDVIRLSRHLRPTTVEVVGLSAALQNLCAQGTHSRRAVLFQQDENLPILPEDVSLALYRIAEESLRNAFTHSRATDIRVELRATGTAIRLSVRDNGCGFVLTSNMKPAFGLSRMSERVRMLGGDFSVVSSPGEGTAVVATMPLKMGSTA